MTSRLFGRLEWRLVLPLGLLGFLFAGLTIAGWIHGWEGRAALVILTSYSVAVALWAPVQPFRHGLATGFVGALLAIETQALFLPTYFANNPEYAELEMPFGLSPRVATAVLGPLNAVVAGLVSGVLAWLLWRLFRRQTQDLDEGDHQA